METPARVIPERKVTGLLGSASTALGFSAYVLASIGGCTGNGASVPPAGSDGEAPPAKSPIVDRTVDTDAAPLSTQPNIVVIMTDDLDESTFDFALALRDLVPTTGDLIPTIRETFVDQGLRFANSFATDPVCCPSRATFLSGQYAHNHCTLSNEPLNGTILKFRDLDALPSWLQQAGYRTGLIGKYLNGYGISIESMPGVAKERDPETGQCEPIEASVCDQLDCSTITSNGSDFVDSKAALCLGCLSRSAQSGMEKTRVDYVPEGWDEWYGLLDISTYCTANYFFNETIPDLEGEPETTIRQYLEDGTTLRYALDADTGLISDPVSDEGFEECRASDTRKNYQACVETKHAENFLRHDSSKPFFLLLSPIASHVEGCGCWDEDGPQIELIGGDDLEYLDQFHETLRPAPEDESDVDTILASGVLETRASWNPFKRPSFNELVILDKPTPQLQSMKRLSTAPREGLAISDIEAVKSQFVSRTVALKSVDRMLARVIATLQEQGRLEQTVFVFMSDNGYMFGSHRLSAKARAYEESARVPLLLWYPGRDFSPVATPASTTAVALNNDLAPTFVELAGASGIVTNADGRSLVSVIDASYRQEPLPEWRRRLLLEYYSGLFASAPIRSAGIDPDPWIALRSFVPPAGGMSYVEHFNGVQVVARAGEPPARVPLFSLGPDQEWNLGWIWQCPSPYETCPNRIGREAYDLATDSHQLWNLLPTGGTPRLLPEQSQELADTLRKLASCAGNDSESPTSCRLLEDTCDGCHY
ncbi:MAG: sulfatase-like hydrolase/transferase [Pseudomonadota bacterium]